MEPQTLKQMALFIAKAEGHASPDKLFQQLRGIANREVKLDEKGKKTSKLIRHTDNKGPKAGFRYSVSEMLSARILLAAICCGVHSAALAKLYNDFRVSSRKLLPDGTQVTLSRDEAISAALDENRRNEEWQLELVHLRDLSSGEIAHGTVWIKNGNRFDNPDPLDEHSFAYSSKIEGSSVIPVTNLLVPLVQSINEESKG